MDDIVLDLKVVQYKVTWTGGVGHNATHCGGCEIDHIGRVLLEPIHYTRLVSQVDFMAITSKDL
jgi:hypothetical protein